MKSPKDMRIIQIDITNACIYHCSNCTRFCGHHKRNFFMDFETFKRAVDSLDEYVGTIGIMGGEPTLNPDFPRMAEYLAKKRPVKQTNEMLRPQKHFMDGIHDLEFEHTFLYPCGKGMRQTVNGPGLWSTTGGNYKKYYEIIQDTIQYQALNDHSNPMFHQPALISRKALNIPDEEWIELRDNCWIQNLWSATITPKGAFFCEVAGALDMLFDGPGGWKIEPGWWKRHPEDFGEQLEWCEMCGLACKTFMRNANEEVYDVSFDMFEKLKNAGSSEIGTSHINIVKIENGVIAEESKAVVNKRFEGSMPYTESYGARYDEANTKLTYKEIVGILVCDNDEHKDYILKNMGCFSEVYVLGSKKFLESIKSFYRGTCKTEYFFTEEHNLGYVIYEALKRMDYNRYALIIEGAIQVNHVLTEMQELVLNPGTLLEAEYHGEMNEYFSSYGKGRVTLLNGVANSIRNAGLDRVLSIQDITELVGIWQPEKVLPFKPEVVYTAPSGNIVPDKKYVVYGAGNICKAAIGKILNNHSEIVAIVDSSKEKWGKEISGYKVKDPEVIFGDNREFDYIMIGSTIFYKEIKETLLKKGFKESEMAWI